VSGLLLGAGGDKVLQLNEVFNDMMLFAYHGDSPFKFQRMLF
jgi:hypothetical protein